MKKATIITIFIFLSNLLKAQSSQDFKQMAGIWKFEIPNEYESYMINDFNKSLKISFWTKSNDSAYTYGTPFSYFGFWDIHINEPQPNHISDLKSSGKYIFFYDRLIKTYDSNNKIGYDSLGNLFQPTRTCEWDIYEKLPYRQKTLELYFNMEPDVYKKVDEIPDYVLISLKKNKEHWQRYLEFLGEKEGSIHVQKSFIYSQPNKQTKMYLLKDDEVEIIEKKEDWLHIRYYGKKVVEGWIKKSDVE
jgi:hypothetical protein